MACESLHWPRVVMHVQICFRKLSPGYVSSLWLQVCHALSAAAMILCADIKAWIGVHGSSASGPVLLCTSSLAPVTGKSAVAMLMEPALHH